MAGSLLGVPLELCQGSGSTRPIFLEGQGRGKQAAVPVDCGRLLSSKFWGPF